MGKITDSDFREDLHRIQVQLLQIIIEDVNTRGGPYTASEVECIIKERLASLARSASLFSLL